MKPQEEVKQTASKIKAVSISDDKDSEIIEQTPIQLPAFVGVVKIS